MKNFTSKIIVAALVIMSVACKKDDVKPSSHNSNPTHVTENSIYGKWNGSYGYGNDNNAYHFGLDFKQSGIIEQFNAQNQIIGRGNWTRSGNQITAQFNSLLGSGAFYDLDAVYDSAAKEIEGDWRYEAAVIYEGRFIVSK